MGRQVCSFAVALAITLLGGCATPASNNGSESSSAPAVPLSNVSLEKADYPVFPDADAGADPAIPAEQGGKGFAGEGWETNTSYGLIGDPHALKGGVYREYITDFPGTLRLGGPEWNTYVNYMIGNSLYETLLGFDPTTLEYIPGLATHWQLSSDKMTFRFRIDPNARWSDGQPVVADDVVATWSFFTDKGLQDPALNAQFAKMEKPVAESKYIVRIKAKTLDWKNFLNVATFMQIFPAHVLKNVDGAAYLRDYNFKYLPNTGPYIISESDIQKGKSISLRRRKDYWAEKTRRNAGLNNFDEIRLVIVRDENLAFEMFKKGDLDSFLIGRSKTWVEELNFDKVQRGIIQKRKIFNNSPQGFNGFAMNTRRKPFDDIRVRKALTFLLNRELMIQKLFYNEYVPMNSYSAGSIYENPNNPKNAYNPQEALKLLAEAGWKNRDSQGRLTKDGKPFEIEMLYDSKQSETYLTVYQEDLRKVGINLNLRLVTFETQFKLIGDRQFDVAELGWGAAPFPDPEVEFHSRLADVHNTDNVTGFKDPRIDEICEKYARTFDQKERIALMKELDGVMTSQYHYILRWSAPSQRIAYWNKFGEPAGYMTRIGQYYGDLNLGAGIERLWWIDPGKVQSLNRAMADASVKLDVGTTDDHYWQEYAKKQEQIAELPKSQ